MLSVEDTAMILCFTVLVIACLVLNGIICVVHYRRKSPRRAASILMLNLTVTDLLIAAFILPRHVFMKMFDYPEGKASDILCKLISGGGFLWISLSASELFLAALAVERYLSVIHPHTKLSSLSRKSMGWVLGTCWALAVAVNVPTMCVLRYERKQDFCIEVWPVPSSPKTYAICIFLVGTISVVSMCVLYTRIILKLWSRQRKATEISQLARIKVRKRVAKALSQVTVIHIICRTPNYTFYLLASFNFGVTYGSLMYEITILLILLNSMLHPYILYWQTQGFRQDIQQLIYSLCSHKTILNGERNNSVGVRRGKTRN